MKPEWKTENVWEAQKTDTYKYMVNDYLQSETN